MMSSLVTIHMSSCDLLIWARFDVSMTTRLLRYMKLFPLIMTSILFRTGSIALSFLALKAYGAIVVVLFIAVLVAVSCATEEGIIMVFKVKT